MKIRRRAFDRLVRAANQAADRLESELGAAGWDEERENPHLQETRRIAEELRIAIALARQAAPGTKR